MKRILFMLFASLLLAEIGFSQTSKQKVAIYVSGNDVEQAYKKIIGAKLVTGITASEGFAAVERTADFLAVLNEEKDYQMSGEVSDNQIVKLGQQFGVRYVLVADLSELFGSIFASVRMINAESGLVHLSTEASAEVSSMADLEKIATTIVENIMLQDKQIKTQARQAEERRQAEIRAQEAQRQAELQAQQEEARLRREVPQWDVLQYGPFTNVKDLWTFTVPSGYRPCSEEEIELLIKYAHIACPAFYNISHETKKYGYGDLHHYVNYYYSTPTRRGSNFGRYNTNGKETRVYGSPSAIEEPGYIYVIRR